MRCRTRATDLSFTRPDGATWWPSATWTPHGWTGRATAIRRPRSTPTSGNRCIEGEFLTLSCSAQAVPRPLIAHPDKGDWTPPGLPKPLIAYPIRGLGYRPALPGSGTEFPFDAFAQVVAVAASPARATTPPESPTRPSTPPRAGRTPPRSSPRFTFSTASRKSKLSCKAHCTRRSPTPRSATP